MHIHIHIRTTYSYTYTTLLSCSSCYLGVSGVNPNFIITGRGAAAGLYVCACRPRVRVSAVVVYCLCVCGICLPADRQAVGCGVCETRRSSGVAPWASPLPLSVRARVRACAGWCHRIFVTCTCTYIYTTHYFFIYIAFMESVWARASWARAVCVSVIVCLFGPLLLLRQDIADIYILLQNKKGVVGEIYCILHTAQYCCQ